MKRINSRIYFLIVALILFLISIIFLFSLNVQGIQYENFAKYNVESICYVKGIYAILGGSIFIEKGYIIKNQFYADENLSHEVNFRFDYLTFLFLILTFISIILVYIFYYKKRKLIYASILYCVSIIGVSFQPSFLWVISSGNSSFDDFFSPITGNAILGIGAIVYVVIMSTILIFLVCRIIYLYHKKLTID